jgi:hypothetical protein
VAAGRARIAVGILTTIDCLHIYLLVEACDVWAGFAFDNQTDTLYWPYVDIVTSKERSPQEASSYADVVYVYSTILSLAFSGL